MAFQERLTRAIKTDRLDVRGLNLTCIPFDIPDNVTEINCSGNRLLHLPRLPKALTRLNCSNNQLTSLPQLPDSLTMLDCSKNYLTELPDLHTTSITHLICSENMITSVPRLPTTLRCFSCHTNNLHTLPEMPQSLILLWAHFNKKMSPYFQSIAESDDPLHELNQYYEWRRHTRRVIKNLSHLNHAIITLPDDVKSLIGSHYSGIIGSLTNQINCLKQQVCE